MEPFKEEIKLVLFDCDGTIVNSELLYNMATSEVLTSLGFPEFTVEYCIHHLAGCSLIDLMSTVKNLGVKDAEAVIKQMHNRVLDLARGNLDAISNAPLLLEAIKLPKCIVSNGERFMVLESIKLTGIDKFFSSDRVFTRELVKNPKPAPDLYLYAAEKMGNFDPKHCLVIEDSVRGIKAGVAAGMRVIGFVGAAHHNDKTEKLMLEAGVSAVVSDLREILGYIPST